MLLLVDYEVKRLCLHTKNTYPERIKRSRCNTAILVVMALFFSSMPEIARTQETRSSIIPKRSNEIKMRNNSASFAQFLAKNNKEDQAQSHEMEQTTNRLRRRSMTYYSNEKIKQINGHAHDTPLITHYKKRKIKKTGVISQKERILRRNRRKRRKRRPQHNRRPPKKHPPANSSSKKSKNSKASEKSSKGNTNKSSKGSDKLPSKETKSSKGSKSVEHGVDCYDGTNPRDRSGKDSKGISSKGGKKGSDSKGGKKGSTKEKKNTKSDSNSSKGSKGNSKGLNDPKAQARAEDGQGGLIPFYNRQSDCIPPDNGNSLPCPDLSLAATCDKYNDATKSDGTRVATFENCYEMCKASYCCIHDSRSQYSPSCSAEPNCPLYSPCYIIWWKLQDTIGPATFLRVGQREPFYETVSFAYILKDFEQDKDFYRQFFGHYFDSEIDGEGNELTNALFEDPRNWLHENKDDFHT